MERKGGFDFVLDCSIAMAWLFEDETTLDTEKVLEQLSDSKAIVPTIWPLEVANVLLIAIKKKRVTKIQAASFIDSLNALPIHVDESTTLRAMHSIFTLANQENLTIYDASYLELAIRENIPIATKDQDLLRAAKKLKTQIL